MMKMSTLDWIALLFLIIGGLNWAFIGFFNLDLVALLFGQMTLISRIIYIIVGLSAVYMIYAIFKQRRVKSV